MFLQRQFIVCIYLSVAVARFLLPGGEMTNSGRILKKEIQARQDYISTKTRAKSYKRYRAAKNKRRKIMKFAKLKRRANPEETHLI